VDLVAADRHHVPRLIDLDRPDLDDIGHRGAGGSAQHKTAPGSHTPVHNALHAPSAIASLGARGRLMALTLVRMPGAFGTRPCNLHESAISAKRTQR